MLVLNLTTKRLLCGCGISTNGGAKKLDGAFKLDSELKFFSTTGLLSAWGKKSRPMENLVSSKILPRSHQSLVELAKDIRRFRMFTAGLRYPVCAPQSLPHSHRRAVMGVGVLTPVLLWLFSSEVLQDQMSKSIKALESFLVRRMVCGMQARSYNQLFIGCCGICKSLVPKTQAIPSNIWQTRSRTRAFQALFDAFQTQPLYRMLTRGRLRLVLEGIDDQLRSSWAESQSVLPRLTIEARHAAGLASTLGSASHW